MGDASRARALADDLAKRFPEDTVVQFNYLPVIRAQLALNRNDASEAIKALQAAIPYELGTPGNGAFTPALYPAYVRGRAYLAAHRGSEAALEFQKILDHRGVAFNEPIRALAPLQLGHAYALAGDTAKSGAAYQDFLTLQKEGHHPNFLEAQQLLAGPAEFGCIARTTLQTRSAEIPAIKILYSTSCRFKAMRTPLTRMTL